MEGQAKFIATECKKRVNKLQGKAGRRCGQQLTPGDQKHAWAKKLLADVQIIPSPAPHPPWFEAPTIYLDKVSAAKAAQKPYVRSMEKSHLNAWTQSWKAYQNRALNPTVAPSGIAEGSNRLADEVGHTEPILVGRPAVVPTVALFAILSIHFLLSLQVSHRPRIGSSVSRSASSGSSIVGAWFFYSLKRFFQCIL